MRDIYERNTIDLKPKFEELSKTIASSIGTPVSATNIANTFKSVSRLVASVKTILSYVDYMQDAFLVEKAERYDIKGVTCAKLWELNLNNPYLGIDQHKPI